MKTLKHLALGLGLVALVTSGCIIVSAQVLTHFALPNPFTINSTVNDHSELVPVDLTTLSEYNDHKTELKGITDVAILGTFTNVNGPAGTVSCFIAPTLDGPPGGSPNAPPSNAILLWGPASIGPTGDVRKIGWDESAALFTKAGKDLLISEVKGDGQFTLYTTGSVGTLQIRVDDGSLVLVLDAGK